MKKGFFLYFSIAFLSVAGLAARTAQAEGEETITEVSIPKTDDDDKVIKKVEPEVEKPEERIVERTEIETPVERPKHRVDLHIEFQWGSHHETNGCLVSNCQSFLPIQRACNTYMIAGIRPTCRRPARRRRRIVYLSEAPSQFFTSNGCSGCSLTQPLTIINATPPPIWMTANFLPRWQPYEARISPVMNPQQQGVFQVPSFPTPTLGQRDIVQIYRTGYHGGSAI